jgi:hypothetical protein
VIRFAAIVSNRIHLGKKKQWDAGASHCWESVAVSPCYSLRLEMNPRLPVASAVTSTTMRATTTVR